MEQFTYVPLDLSSSTFRLVRLLQGSGQKLECELFHASFDEDENVMPYEALSYTWGSDTTPDTIKMNGKQLRIGANLHLALLDLREPFIDRILWIDALCIDQSRDEERGHQVQRMGKIYSQATTVVIWLGTATEETNVLLDTLKFFHRVTSTQYACKNWTLSDHRWTDPWSTTRAKMSDGYPQLKQQQQTSLETLLARPWFKRVWVIQEVANARAAVVCCGERTVSARTFTLAPLLLEFTPPPHCQALLDVMPGWARTGSWWNNKRDLRTLIRKFSASEAKDPRDQIYALLGISSDASNEPKLRPDYTRSSSSVIAGTLEFMLGLSELDVQPSGFQGFQDFIRYLEYLDLGVHTRLTKLSLHSHKVDEDVKNT